MWLNTQQKPGYATQGASCVAEAVRTSRAARSRASASYYRVSSPCAESPALGANENCARPPPIRLSDTLAKPPNLRCRARTALALARVWWRANNGANRSLHHRRKISRFLKPSPNAPIPTTFRR